MSLRIVLSATILLALLQARGLLGAQPIAAQGLTLTVSTAGTGTVEITTSSTDPDNPYPMGAVVHLVPYAPPGFLLSEWTVDGTPRGWASPLLLVMDGNHTVSARFVAMPTFADVPVSNEAYAAISQLSTRGIIHGYGDGRFGPGDTTLRAQMAALIARAMEWDTENHGNSFSDRGPVDDDLWRDIGTLAYYQVAHGYGDGTYGPTNEVLYAQVVSFITRAMVAKHYWVQEITDDPTLYPNITVVSGHRMDILTYYHNAGPLPDTTANGAWLTWDAPSTRQWFAQALWQALNRHFAPGNCPLSPRGGVTYQFDPAVGISDRAIVAEGINRANCFLETIVGGNAMFPFTAKVSADTGDGACCSAGGTDLNIHTQHPAWTNGYHNVYPWSLNANDQKILIHEYTHLWQSNLGCLRYYNSSTWVYEGMAEYIAYQTMVHDGLMTSANVNTFQTSVVKYNALPPLSEMETAVPPSNGGYSVAYLAIGQLVARAGFPALRDFCSRVGAGQDWHQVFLATFGISLAEFYSQFEQYRAQL